MPRGADHGTGGERLEKQIGGGCRRRLDWRTLQASPGNMVERRADAVLAGDQGRHERFEQHASPEPVVERCDRRGGVQQYRWGGGHSPTDHLDQRA